MPINQTLVQTAGELYGSQDTSAGLGEALSEGFSGTFDKIEADKKAAKEEARKEAKFKLSQEIGEENLLSLQADRDKRTYDKEQRGLKIQRGKELLGRNNINIAQQNMDEATETSTNLGNIIKGQAPGENPVFENRTYSDDELIRIGTSYNTQLEGYQANLTEAANVINDPDFDADGNPELFDVAESIASNGYTLRAYNPKTNTFDAVVTVDNGDGTTREVVIPGGDFKSYFGKAKPNASFSSIYSELEGINANMKKLSEGGTVNKAEFDSIISESDQLFRNEDYRESFINSLPKTKEVIDVLADGVVTADEAKSVFDAMLKEKFKGQIKEKTLSAKDQADIQYKKAQTLEILNKLSNSGRESDARDLRLINSLYTSGNLIDGANTGPIGDTFDVTEGGEDANTAFGKNIIKQYGPGKYFIPRTRNKDGSWESLPIKGENLKSLDATNVFNLFDADAPILATDFKYEVVDGKNQFRPDSLSADPATQIKQLAWLKANNISPFVAELGADGNPIVKSKDVVFGKVDAIEDTPVALENKYGISEDKLESLTAITDNEDNSDQGVYRIIKAIDKAKESIKLATGKKKESLEANLEVLKTSQFEHFSKGITYDEYLTHKEVLSSGGYGIAERNVGRINADYYKTSPAENLVLAEYLKDHTYDELEKIAKTYSNKSQFIDQVIKEGKISKEAIDKITKERSSTDRSTAALDSEIDRLLGLA